MNVWLKFWLLNNLLCISLGSVPFCLMAQDTAVYLVYVTEKTALAPEPGYLSAATQARCARMGLLPWDTYDLPVSEAAYTAVAATGSRIRHVLRWFNALSVAATPLQLRRIRQLPEVVRIERLDGYQPALAGTAAYTPPEGFDTLLYAQRQQLHMDTLTDAGLTGRGVRIAVFDAGFKGVDAHPAFAGVRERGGILATRDFYDGDTTVYHHSRHGTQVLACIAGMYEGRPIGAAPNADFLLARVEHAKKEPVVEEDHWLAAAEWAHRMGADLINSSLSYTAPRYDYYDMDGLTAPVSRAASIAIRKGILVINSIGNEGDASWHYLGAPADVPGVLTVGGSMPVLPLRIKFSSFGPNARGVLKPEVAAPGFVLSTHKKDRYIEQAGTSFSTPLVTGIAACYLQAHPALPPVQLKEALCRSGHLFPYYDYELGYGILDCARLLGKTSDPDTVFRVFHLSDSVVLAFDTTHMADSVAFPFGRVLHYHLADEQDKLKAHFAIRIPNKSRYYFFRRTPGSAGTLRIWMDGYLHEEELWSLE